MRGSSTRSMAPAYGPYPGVVPVVVYSVLRLLLFAVALAALWFAGLRGWLLVLVAAAVALMLSYLTLRKPREAASRYLAERAEHRARTGERFSREIEDDAAAEDAAVDADVTTEQPGTSPTR